IHPAYAEAGRELVALAERLQRARGALDATASLRARADGVIADVAVRRGDAVDAGDPQFAIAGANPLGVAVTIFDPSMADATSWTLPRPDGRDIALTHAGIEPASSGPGWRLLLEGAAD